MGNRGLSGEGRFLDNKENVCGDGLTGSGNSLVKNRRDKKKGGNAPSEARLVTSFENRPSFKRGSTSIT